MLSRKWLKICRIRHTIEVDFYDPKVQEEYDSLAPEYDLIQAMIDARLSQNITQKEFSVRTGITQADISRIENGTRNPSLAVVKRIAEGLRMQLRLEFVPTPAKH